MRFCDDSSKDLERPEPNRQSTTTFGEYSDEREDKSSTIFTPNRCALLCWSFAISDLTPKGI